MKELINIPYNLENYSFQPGVQDDQMLGQLCLMGELLTDIEQVSDEVFPVATREEMEAVWDAEEAVVMEAQMRML